MSLLRLRRMAEELLQFLVMSGVGGLFVGSLFFSETLVIPAAILSVQGFWTPTEIFAAVLMGTIIKDSFWFISGRKAFSFVEQWARLHEGLETIERHSRRLMKHPLLLLLVYKLAYGTRTATILYLSRSSSVRLVSFTFFNAIGTAIWLFVTISVGRLAGAGIINLLPAL